MSQAQKYAAHCNDRWSKELQASSALAQDPGPPPTAQVAIITCMDARLDPFRMFGLALGEAHVIRPGGGRAPDALRSLIASQQVLGTAEVMVVHHTDCGFARASGEDAVRAEVREGLGGLSAENICFMPITKGPEESVRADVNWLRRSPFVKRDAKITGWVYETRQGTIEEVKC